MGMAYRGVTHCYDCGNSLKNTEYFTCDLCRAKNEVHKDNKAEVIEILQGKIKALKKELDFQLEINKIEQDRHKRTEKSLKGQIHKQNIIIKDMEKIMNNKDKFFKKVAEDNEFYVSEIEKKNKTIIKIATSWKQDDVRSVEEIIKYFEEGE